MPTLTPEQFIADSAAAHYKPTLLGSSVQQWVDGQRGWYTWREVEGMRRDPDIVLGLMVLRAPMHRVTWTVKSSTAGVAEYVDRTLKRFWTADRNKALRLLEYGSSCGELDWRIASNGMVEYLTLNEFHVSDVRLLTKGNKFHGFRLNQSEDKVMTPRAFWVADRPEFGSFYGWPRLAGAYLPWREANGRHGAKDVRRLWYLKNAYRGGVIFHPTGVVQLEDGRTVSYQDYAREVVEKGETGGVYAFPNTRGVDGQRLWEMQDPKPNGNIEGVREYAKDLTEEKWTGMGIPIEVMRATITGAWAGRTIPFLVYLAGEDEIAQQIITAFERCALQPAVKVNFGEQAQFAIELSSLTKLAEEDPTRVMEGEEDPIDPRLQRQPQQRPAMLSHEPRPIQYSERLRRRAARLALRRYPLPPIDAEQPPSP